MEAKPIHEIAEAYGLPLAVMQQIDGKDHGRPFLLHETTSGSYTWSRPRSVYAGALGNKATPITYNHQWTGDITYARPYLDEAAIGEA